MALDLNKLSAAKLWLISAPNASTTGSAPRGLPYLAHALYALVAIETAEVARMTCDEYWRIYVNPTWFDGASVPEVGRELAHVTWHLLSDHAGRARSLGVDRSTANHWAMASDVAVSRTLDSDDTRPALLPTATSQRLREGKSAEEYYAVLSGLPASGAKSPDPAPLRGCGSGADGIPRPNEFGLGADVGAVNELESRSIRERVAVDYREHSAQRGTDPGDALRWVREVLEPEVPWDQILRSSIKRAVARVAGHGFYTYARTSRRATSQPGIVLPGQYRPVPQVSVIVDTSGSVDDQLLARALGEIDGVIASIGISGASVTVYSVDAAVHTTKNLRSARDAQLIGAGGTDLRTGLKAIEDERPRPDVVLVLTDGDTPWPENPPPGCVVIIAMLGRKGAEPLPPTPRWAVRVECLLEEW